jgi:ribosomal protein S27AE
MSHKEPPMICPKCGATMNHHATKVDYAVEDGVENSTLDPAFDGVLEEVHTCPRCGHIELRHASD